MRLTSFTRCAFLLVMAFAIPDAGGLSGSAWSADSPAVTAVVPKAGETEELSLLARDTKQYLSKLTEERNQLRSANETYATRQGLLIGYGIVMTLLSVWLMMRSLSSRTANASDKKETDAFPVTGVHSATGNVRKNATITIRNGSTQKAEVTEKLQTRRAFARAESGQTERMTRTDPASNATALQHQRVTSTTKRPISDRIVAPELEPNRTSLQPTLGAPGANGGTATTKHPTVRVEQSTSDRLEPVEVTVKPGTGSQTKPRP